MRQNLRFLATARLVRLLGSLKLAMLLLAILIVGCIVGTVAESRLDAAVAQAYIYDAPWFAAWLLLLCANLACSVLVRYPWKPHQLGFIITHAGIIVLLAGAMLGRLRGIEGNVTLYKGGRPETSLLINQTVLQVQTAQMTAPVSHPVDLRSHAPTAERPLHWRIGNAMLSVLGYSESLGVQQVVDENDPAGAPGLQLHLQSAMGPTPVDSWLVLGDPRRSRLSFGPAEARLVAEGSSQEAARSAASEDGDATAGAAVDREKHFAFAKMPEMAVARVVSGKATGIKAIYHFNESAPESKGLLELRSGDQRFEFRVADVLGKSQALPGTSWTLEGVQFLPDFRMQDKEAISASDQPRNPAVVFEIVGTSGGAACHHADEACDMADDEKSGCCPKPSPATRETVGAPAGLTLIYRPDGHIRYQTHAKGQPTAQGDARVGQPFATGLSDWKATVQKVAAHVSFRQELAPVGNALPGARLAAGVLVRCEQAGRSVERWIPYGPPTHLLLDKEHVLVSLGLKTQPLGFEVALDKFEVERNEGTQTPAGFKSYVSFTDPVTKASVHREIWMNHPASFPEVPGANLLGTAYKFSQASWNPDDLNQTTLQVVRDPGWSLKWIGSVLLCAGLCVMFYFKPYPRRPNLNNL